MSDVFGSIWWLIVSLGVLVTFHEFGHYWVARRCGVRVLRFSVGFGTPLFKRIGRDGVEWVVAAIPLGGYVKMLDEREGDVPAHLVHEAFNRKSVGKRFAIVAAGPLFNLLLTVLLLWGAYMIGKTDYAPLIGTPAGIAADAGLRVDDRIVAIDGDAVETWTHASIALTRAGLERRPVVVDVVGSDRTARTVDLDLSRLGAFDERYTLREIGLTIRQRELAPVLSEVTAGKGAAAAGLRAGDRVVAIDGQPIAFFSNIGPRVQAYVEGAPPLRVEYERDGERRTVDVQPYRAKADDREYWALGVKPKVTEAPYDALLQFGPIDAFGVALRETRLLSGATVDMLWKIVQRVASLGNISGPLTIAQVANESAKSGAGWFLYFLAIMSLSLCIMNLLPIPILDGGHLLYYFIEMIKGSPVSERALIAGQYVGLVILAGLMGLAFYNDISGLVARLAQ